MHEQVCLRPARDRAPLPAAGKRRREELSSQKKKVEKETKELQSNYDKIEKYLQEIDETAHARLESLMSLLTKQNGVTEELKARDQMAWVGLMNSLKHQAEEMILSELVYA